MYEMGEKQKAAMFFNMASRYETSSKPLRDIGKTFKLLGKATNAYFDFQTFMESTSATDPTVLLESIDPSAIADVDPTSALDTLSQLFEE